MTGVSDWSLKRPDKKKKLYLLFENHASDWVKDFQSSLLRTINILLDSKNIYVLEYSTAVVLITEAEDVQNSK